MTINYGIAIFLLVGLTVCADPYRKIIHDTDHNAKCLDGSSPMIYLHEGGDTKNIIFYMIGGGACIGTTVSQVLESCYKRSKGQFGTSTVWPDVYPSANAGFLSTDPAKSKFANWTKIVIMYCDGAFHQGNNKSPIKYKDRDLYFRGAVNTRSHIKYADLKYNLSNAQKIIVSGSSAGGIATYIWFDHIRSLVPNPSKVYGVADSGVFYDPLVNIQLKQDWTRKDVEEYFLNYQNQQMGNSLRVGDDPNPIQILMQLSNADERPPNKQCSNLLSQDEQWKCLFIQFSYPTLQAPMLFVQSSYDQFVIEAVFQFKCLTKGVSGYTMKNCTALQQQAIQIYRVFYLERFLPKLYKYGHSIWSISCVWHALMIDDQVYDSPLQQVPMHSGRTIRNAVQSFVFQGKKIEYIDVYAWPGNTPCAY